MWQKIALATKNFEVLQNFKGGIEFTVSYGIYFFNSGKYCYYLALPILKRVYYPIP